MMGYITESFRNYPISYHKRLLIIISIFTFFLSAFLDNLTTAIVMCSISAKFIHEKEDRMGFAGMIIIAANAGGVWS